MAPPPGKGRPYPQDDIDEADKSFTRLLEGLRTTLPGAQVLLGFLFILPFQAEFSSMSDIDLVIYQVAFYSAALASVLLIAPSVHQRFRAPMTGIRRNDKAHVDVAVWVSLAGSVALGVAITASTALVGSAVSESWVATVMSSLVGLTVVYTWALQPLVQFRD